MMVRKSRYRVLSLFSGCGGMDLGTEGGFEFLGKRYSRLATETKAAVELDPRIAEIYESNFRAPCVVKDIRDLDAKDLPSHDVMTGGFPCQSFSMVAQNPPRLGHDDERGRLYFEMCRLLLAHRPQVFIAENVKGLLSANQKQAFPLLLEEFRQCGYHIHWDLLDAADYGVPQRRQRVFIVGFRNLTASTSFKFPRPVADKYRSVLGDVLHPRSEVEEKYFFSDRALRGLAKTRNGSIKTKGRVQDANKPCNTVGAHLAKVSLNSTDPVVKTAGRIRMFSPREVARIQSFPESFQLRGVKTTDYKALGNAVPPVLMWHVMRSVLKALESSAN